MATLIHRDECCNPFILASSQLYIYLSWNSESDGVYPHGLMHDTGSISQHKVVSWHHYWHFTELELPATEHLFERFLLVHIIRVVGPQCSVDTQLRLQTHYHSISLTALAGTSLHTHTGASVGCTVIINCLVTS